MKHFHPISLKKSIALAAGIAALAVPASAAAYPLIPDEPGNAAVSQGQAWLVAHKQRAKSKPTAKTTHSSTCPGKTGRVRCVKP